VGTDDAACTAGEAADWGSQSEFGCGVVEMVGGHFFVHDRPDVTLRHIERDITMTGAQR
jgi:surfactin synthase thioesterase subunit